MLDFDQVLTRYGEFVVWGILENWERYRGIRSITPLPLEERWARFMRETEDATVRVAA
jgi:hypothetical protein